MSKIDNVIVRAGIYPAIGVARVGNSREIEENEGWFAGPEVTYPLPQPPGFSKDNKGALKRQGVRFRIYGYNAAGQVVKEITADDPETEIEWSAHVANKKAYWYDFEVALDIPEAVPLRRRNNNFKGEDRKKLWIDGGKVKIKGKNKIGNKYYFEGKFIDKKVYLGELRTDDAGRLIFLGGRGESDSPFKHNRAGDFANNDGWHDDTSDGPVNAKLRIGGQKIEVDPAWVVTTPPNYGTEIIGVRSMYHVIQDTLINGLWMEAPKKTSFVDDIYPILYSFVNTQWVNQGHFVQFGFGAPNEFLRPDYLARLAQSGDEFKELRNQIFNMFRNPDFATTETMAWPFFYGDAVSITPPIPARNYLAMTSTQYTQLKNWKNGDFESDIDRLATIPHTFKEVPPAEQPHMLTKAALWFCLGEAFHPGCEMTWPMRNYTMYRGEYRIRVRDENDPEPEYGPILTPEVALSTSGPLFFNGPGDITRWMAVPWQTDTASCRSGYTPDYDPYLPTFWPARVPNQVLTEADYQIVMNTELPRADRIAAFNRRVDWLRFLLGNQWVQVNQMVEDFWRLGVVEHREGLPDDPDFPDFFYVESTPEFGINDPMTKKAYFDAEKKFGRHLRSSVKKDFSSD